MRGQRLWGMYCLLTSLAMPFLQVLFNMYTENATGLAQKVTIAVGWGWSALFAARLLRRQSSSAHFRPDHCPGAAPGGRIGS